MRLKLLRKTSVFTRRGLTVFGLAIAAALAIGATTGASTASAQGLRFGGGSIQIYGGNGGVISGGYRAGYPRRGPRVQVYRGGGHYDYHGPSVHYDRVFHPEYSHWTPLRGYHTHGHYDLVSHYTPGHYDYHRGGHHGGHHGHDPFHH